MRLNRIRVILPAFAAAGAALAAGSAAAETVNGAEATPQVSFTYNLYWVSDYRGRGVSYTSNDPALQGGADLYTASGWSASVWASSFPDDVDADAEIDLYAAKAFELGHAELALGGTLYVFPGADDWDFWEAQASVSMPVGPVDASLTANYAWEQENLADEDDFYITLEAATPIGRFLGAPLTLSASAGWEDGFFAVEDTKTDWSVGLAADISGVEFAVSYMDTSLSDEVGDGGWVFSIGRTFG